MKPTRVVAVEVAAALLAVGAIAGPRWLAAVVVLLVSWVLAWAAHLRKRTPAPPAALRDWLRPGAGSDGDGVLADAYGLTAVLELGDPTAILVDAQPAVPAPATLLPPTGAVQVQLLGAAPRAFLAVHVDRGQRRTLDSALRRIRRRLDRAGVPHAPADLDVPVGNATSLVVSRAGAEVVARPVDPATAGLVQVVDRQTAARLRRDGATPVDPGALAPHLPAIGGGGLTIGVNRDGAPVAVRLFRPVPTRVFLAGGVDCARLVVARALALGVRVAVQTARPQAWAGFVRAAGPTDALALVPPGRALELAPATPARPQLVVLDEAHPVPPIDLAWRATLVVRADLTGADADALAGADLALLQPLDPAAAALAGAALGLGDTAEWLTRIRADMIGLVAGRRAVRWALLAATPAESQLAG